MDVAATREQLLADDEFVLSELQRLQVLYGLKNETRYALDRTATDGIEVESVADHIYGMHVIAPYFVALEDTEGSWDQEKISAMISYHDLDEIVTGDSLSWEKGADRTYERQAEKEVLAQLPKILGDYAQQAVEEYVAYTTPEAKFVRALDKIEPIFHLYNDNGKKITLYLNTEMKQHKEAKEKYTKGFPYLQRFNEVMLTRMDNEGFFVPSSD